MIPRHRTCPPQKKNLGNRQDIKGLEENWTDHKEIYER
jgi:hypothetical protein